MTSHCPTCRSCLPERVAKQLSEALFGLDWEVDNLRQSLAKCRMDFSLWLGYDPFEAFDEGFGLIKRSYREAEDALKGCKDSHSWCEDHDANWTTPG